MSIAFASGPTSTRGFFLRTAVRMIRAAAWGLVCASISNNFANSAGS
ncbi:Uncharacterised protein [Mycobacteroides abscessus subsp. abscessus]|nr:Uncharacterised protein [Mycobacteroides abscessus subsp. abscessus]